MSNEQTPDTPEAEDSASIPVEPTTSPSSDVPATGAADPTVDVMSDSTSADDPTEPVDADPGAADPAADPIAGPVTGDPAEEATAAPAATATTFSEGAGAGYVPPQPPPYAVVPPVRRLVRDPYSRLGGVCSGIAHHTGVDVSLVRLGFVLATLFSGIGLILYLLAWLIVPRAEYWPPAPYEAGGSGGSLLEGRQLAYGLLAIGIVLVIFSGAGGFARMLVSVGLVGAGIWLLVQPQSQSRSDTTAPGATGGSVPPVPPTSGPAAPNAVTGSPVTGNVTEAVPPTWQPAPGHVGPDTSGDEMAGQLPGQVTAEYSEASTPAGPPPPNEVKTVYVPSPVPPRRRRIWPFLLIFLILLIPVIFVVGAIAFLVSFDEEFTEANVVITPATAADIPGRIDEGAGTITLDLTDLDVDDFADTSATPQEIEIDLNAGEVTVDLPRDFPVTVDASVGAGEINVLDRNEEGIRPRITTDDPDAVLELDIRVGVGSISVDD